MCEKAHPNIRRYTRHPWLLLPASADLKVSHMWMTTTFAFPQYFLDLGITFGILMNILEHFKILCGHLVFQDFLLNPPLPSFLSFFCTNGTSALGSCDVANILLLFCNAVGLCIFPLSWVLRQVRCLQHPGDRDFSESCNFKQNIDCALGMVILRELQKRSDLSNICKSASFWVSHHWSGEGRGMGLAPSKK